jgi:transcriptional regulator GlxA family with amidase domain
VSEQELIVEEDHGRARSLAIARKLVMFLVRPGGQAQFSRVLAGQAISRRPFNELHAWMIEHVADRMTVEALASRGGMSPRHFARTFSIQMGMPPARFIDHLRVEAGQRMLEQSSHGLEAIAARCGFGSADSMRRSFLRVLGVTASEYARRFARH